MIVVTTLVQSHHSSSIIETKNKKRLEKYCESFWKEMKMIFNTVFSFCIWSLGLLTIDFER